MVPMVVAITSEVVVVKVVKFKEKRWPVIPVMTIAVVISVRTIVAIVSIIAAIWSGISRLPVRNSTSAIVSRHLRFAEPNTRPPPPRSIA